MGVSENAFDMESYAEHLAMEWGFRACEKGWNLDRARAEFNKMLADRSAKDLSQSRQSRPPLMAKCVYQIPCDVAKRRPVCVGCREGKPIRPPKPATVQRDAARANRHQWIDQLLLVVRIMSFDPQYEAHIQKAQKGYARDGAWNYLVCLHLPTGPVSWMLTPEDMEMFSHLTDQSHPWDRCTQQEKIDRLRNCTGNAQEMLVKRSDISAAKPLKEPRDQ